MLDSGFLGTTQGRPVGWDLSRVYIAQVSRDRSEATMGHTGRTGLSKPRVAWSSSRPRLPLEGWEPLGRKPLVRAGSWGVLRMLGDLLG